MNNNDDYIVEDLDNLEGFKQVIIIRIDTLLQDTEHA